MFDFDKFYVRAADGRFRTQDADEWGTLVVTVDNRRCPNPELAVYDSREQAVAESPADGSVLQGWELLPTEIDPHRTSPPAVPVTYLVGPPGMRTPIHVDLSNPDQHLWMIRWCGECLNKAGEWEYEPLPSNRDAEFVARTRYRSVDGMDVIERARAALLQMPEYQRFLEYTLYYSE